MKTQLKTLVLALSILSITSCNAKDKKQNLAMRNVETEHHNPNKQFIKVALLLDTSNSMDGLIDQAKAQLWEIVNELSYAKCGNNKPNLEIALYEYGNDRLVKKVIFVRFYLLVAI
jgi:hypothetical protein